MLEILKTLLKQCGTEFEDFGEEIRIPVDVFTYSNKNFNCLILPQPQILEHSDLWYKDAIISIRWNDEYNELDWAIFEED